MFIIQDAELSHNLTLLSVLSHTMSLLTVTFTGLLASHLQRMASQCRSVVQTFLCVDVVKHYCPCSVCVYVVLWLLCMYAWKEICMDGWVTGSTLEFLTTDVWNTVLKLNTPDILGTLEVKRGVSWYVFFLALLEVFSKMKYEPKALESLVQLYKIFQLYTCHSACAYFGDSCSFYTLFGIFKK